MTYLSYTANRKSPDIYPGHKCASAFLLCKGDIIFISVVIIEAEIQGLWGSCLSLQRV